MLEQFQKVFLEFFFDFFGSSYTILACIKKRQGLVFLLFDVPTNTLYKYICPKQIHQSCLWQSSRWG